MIKLFPKKIYVYKDNQSFKLCVYICDTDNANEIIAGCIEDINSDINYLKLQNGMTKVLKLDKFLRLKHSQIQKPLMLQGKCAEITSSEFQQVTLAIYKLLINKLSHDVNMIAVNNFSNNALKNIALPEKIIKLLTWTDKKTKLKFNYNSNLIIMEHCIYFAYMGTNIGAEIEKLRPVVVWRKHINKSDRTTNLYYVFPITSKKPSKNYPSIVKINVNNQENYVKINQGRVLSIKRFEKIFLDETTKKVARLSLEEISNIKNSIKIYFGV